MTRLDIALTISIVRQLLNFYSQDHWNAIVQILKYITKTLGKGLINEDKGNTQIVGYSDTN